MFPVRTLIACVSVVVSRGGRSDLMCALASVKLIDLWTRVMSPPPLTSARSCRMVVKLGNVGVLCGLFSLVSCKMAMCMLCCFKKCSSSCFFVFMPSMFN